MFRNCAQDNIEIRTNLTFIKKERERERERTKANVKMFSHRRTTGIEQICLIFGWSKGLYNNHSILDCFDWWNPTVARCHECHSSDCHVSIFSSNQWRPIQEDFHVGQDASQLFCPFVNEEQLTWRFHAEIVLDRSNVKLQHDRLSVHWATLPASSRRRAWRYRRPSSVMETEIQLFFHWRESVSDWSIEETKTWAKRTKFSPRRFTYSIGRWGFRSHWSEIIWVKTFLLLLNLIYK